MLLPGGDAELYCLLFSASSKLVTQLIYEIAISSRVGTDGCTVTYFYQNSVNWKILETGPVAHLRKL